jgi:hypothetical protein
VTFSGKEVFDQIVNLDNQKPNWKTDSENPINYFVPNSEKGQKQSDALKALKDIQRMKQISLLTGKRR